MPKLTDKSIQGVFTKADDGTFRIVASTAKVDRDNEVILPRAFKKSLKPYLENNPVILPSHDYRAFAIGKAVDGKVTKEALELTIEFADTEMGREAKYLYENKFMSAFSVGFIRRESAKQQEISELLKNEGIEFDEKAPPWRVYTEVELLEVSAVSVPSNAAATVIRQAIDQGAELPMMAKMFLSDEDNVEVATAVPASDQLKQRTKSQKINSYFRRKI